MSAAGKAIATLCNAGLHGRRCRDVPAICCLLPSQQEYMGMYMSIGAACHCRRQVLCMQLDVSVPRVVRRIFMQVINTRVSRVHVSFTNLCGPVHRMVLCRHSLLDCDSAATFTGDGMNDSRRYGADSCQQVHNSINRHVCLRQALYNLGMYEFCRTFKPTDLTTRENLATDRCTDIGIYNDDQHCWQQ